MDKTNEIETWVQSNLIVSDENGYSFFSVYQNYENYEPKNPKFNKNCILYSIEMSHSYIETLVDGNTSSPDFKYIELMKAMRLVSESEECFWIHITQPDNAIAIIENVRKHAWRNDISSSYQLVELEQKPADEGGSSFMCLLSKDKSWILVHEMNPGNDFTISLHSNDDFKLKLINILGIEEVQYA